MSSIVSRRPPFSGAGSHKNERRWMSIRFGTSTVLLRRAKVRRVRRASAAAKKRLLRRARKRAEERAEARLVKIAQAIDALKWAADAHGPRPRSPRMWRDVVSSGTATAIGQQTGLYLKKGGFVKRG